MISKQLDSTPKTDESHEFAAQIATMKEEFMNEIHALKIEIEQFKRFFKENGKTLSDKIIR